MSKEEGQEILPGVFATSKGLKMVELECGVYESELTIKSSSKVTVVDQYALWKEGKVVAAIDGVYDFSNVPKQYHETLVQLLINTPRHNLYLPGSRVKATTTVKAPKRYWWERIFKW